MKPLRFAVVYYSRTGSVARLADRLRKELEPFGQVEMARIEPVHKHSYWGWLARSFLPGWRSTIRPTAMSIQGCDAVCLGFPKWTISCPPLNRYIRDMDIAEGASVGLFMSCGGFDSERYLRSVARKVGSKGARIAASVAVRRKNIHDRSCAPAMERFCGQLLENLTRVQVSMPASPIQKRFGSET